ncbi:sentrin-specific protease 7-like isoform X3 [Micropterus dolomieu]|uniref:sentrin-specific protease 7-like isoform X3 n=1 Tax=Micropterus dolomieu TaxID=147949 RepID=UPI001E8CF1C7|nr:sentrin-specific protease 7-like isoform X3 [Micropterus dolomieu]
MASPFKIPKKKQPAGSDSSHLHSQSPLSRLQSPAPEFKGYGHQSSRGGADRMHAGNALGSSTSRQRDYVKSLLGLNSPNRGAPTANRRAPGSCGRQSQPGQRAQSSSGCVSNGWRPKRASDRLLPPDEASEPLTPPQKKKSDLRGPPLSTKNISVESLDYLAELRGEERAGSLSSPTQKKRTWRRVDAAEEKSDSGSSPESLKQQQKSSVSGSDQTSEDDFVSPPRAGNKPLPKDVRRPCCAPRSTPDARRGLNRTSWLVANNNLMEDLREKEREKWRAFREKKTANRSAVLQLRLRKPKAAEPIVLSSEEEEEGEDDADGGKRTLQSSSLLDESHLGKPERMQGQQACSSKGEVDGFKPAPPSFLQLNFASLHAGLTHADASGEMMITEHGFIIPLKGVEEGQVSVVASQIRGYGVWDGGVAQGGGLLAGWKGPAPSLIFLWVTDAQATLLQTELSAIRTSTAASGPVCSFLLLVLKEQLQELQAALLASILDMEEYKKASSSSSGPTSPLEWTDGLLLLHSCPPPLDQHLLGLLGHSVEKSSPARKSNLRSSALQQLPTRLIQYPAAPCKGRITVTKEDLACLASGEFLNDVIIDFYLKYLLLEGVGGSAAERSHVFSSFFYKQLSRRRAAGEDAAPSVPDRHMRHQRVKTWTRHVDIFTKDFLFVPVNQDAHWYLVVVCFPGLEEVQHEEFQRPTGGSERAAGNPSLSLRPQQPPECTQQGWQRDTVLKRPCILVMDSLKLSYHENVCRLVRDYLQVEWEVRRGTPRLFTSDSMRSFSCKVPQQDNSSDCGLYLLQYAESFLQNPVVHFDLPLRLDSWFPRQRVRQKREEIRSLIMRMHQSNDS